MIDVGGIRFLYTKQTVELIIHHLINNFDFEKHRKSDFIDIENNSGADYKFSHSRKEGSSSHSKSDHVHH